MLVTPSDLATYMDISFSNRQEDAAEFVLAGLQSEMEGELRRPVEVQEFDEVYPVDSGFVALPNTSFFYSPSLARNLDTYIYVGPVYSCYLRNTPIVEIDTVEVRSYNQTDPIPQLPGKNYIVRPYGMDLYWVAPTDSIRVVYRAGLDGEAIPMLRSLILRAATREMQNMHDDTVGVKDLNTRNVAPLITGFTPEERQAMRRWRRVRVA